MQASEGLAVRAYESSQMYRGSHDLLPNESPRRQYPFPTEPKCPHCERTDRVILRETYFSCVCGLHLYNVTDALPLITKDVTGPKTNKGRGPMVTCICNNPKCAATFQKRPNNPSELCTKCRRNATTKKWQEEHPERCKEIARTCQENRMRKRRAARVAQEI